jgi:hypothetical protein
MIKEADHFVSKRKTAFYLLRRWSGQNAPDQHSAIQNKMPDTEARHFTPFRTNRL